MTTATIAAPNAGAALGIDRLFLGLALIATAVLVAAPALGAAIVAVVMKVAAMELLGA